MLEVWLYDIHTYVYIYIIYIYGVIFVRILCFTAVGKLMETKRRRENVKETEPTAVIKYIDK